jgi:UDP-N-acetylglucosamine:LPS N-acetylglucosamine transferase
MKADSAKFGTGRQVILAIASSGGHWQQLLMLRGAFDGNRMIFLTTLKGLGEGLDDVRTVPDCNRNKKLTIIRCFFALLIVMLRVRPDVVISTGALPGLLALIIAKALGKRTIWVDSVANAEEFSLAGLKARRYADLWLSQWPDVAERTGAEYAGSVL